MGITCPPAEIPPVVCPPTLAGFTAFVQTQMGIDGTNLPPSSPAIAAAYWVAINIVNKWLRCVSPQMYLLAVYNLAASNLIEFAQDVPPQTYFQDLRERWHIDSFTPGVVQSSSDVTTSASLTVPESLGQLSLADLQYMKSPSGRTYLSIAPRAGPTLWGIT